MFACLATTFWPLQCRLVMSFIGCLFPWEESLVPNARPVTNSPLAPETMVKKVTSTVRDSSLDQLFKKKKEKRFILDPSLFYRFHLQLQALVSSFSPPTHSCPFQIVSFSQNWYQNK